MLVVKVEMWPGGNPEKAYEMTRAYIANDVKTTNETKGEYGTYNARFMQSVRFSPDKVWKRGKAEHIHRRRRGIWDILFVALRSAGLDKRNPL
jgi:hypothetical protein